MSTEDLPELSSIPPSLEGRIFGAGIHLLYTMCPELELDDDLAQSLLEGFVRDTGPEILENLSNLPSDELTPKQRHLLSTLQKAFNPEQATENGSLADS